MPDGPVFYGFRVAYHLLVKLGLSTVGYFPSAIFRRLSSFGYLPSLLAEKMLVKPLYHGCEHAFVPLGIETMGCTFDDKQFGWDFNLVEG